MRRLSILLGLALLLALPVACRSTPAAEEAAPALEATSQAPTPEAMAEQPVAMPTTDVMAFDPAVGGDLVIGQGQEPDQLYIYGSAMLAASHIWNDLYDGPIEGLDYDFQPVILEKLPKLEEAGSGARLEMVDVNEGDRYVDSESQEVLTATEPVGVLPQLTVRFTIREGVTWQDGTPVTAEDSVFSWNLSCDPLTPTSKFTCERTAAYEALDDHTVEWQGLPGFTDQTYYGNFVTPLPRQQTNEDGVRLDEMAPDKILSDETFTRKPFSYGPFVIEEWVSGDHITLRRNDYYWRKNEGLPFLDSVIHRFITDSNALLVAVSNGEVDVATQDGLDISQSQALDKAAAEGRLVPYYVIGTAWEHIDFDLDPIDGRPPLAACPDLRHAIALGTDRETMVNQIQKGKSAVQSSYVPEVHWAYPPEDMLVKYEYDPGAAAQMLEDMGFVDSDGDGYREAQRDITCTITLDLAGNTKEQRIPAGTPLELSLSTNAANVMREDTSLLFQDNMAEIGVKIDLNYLPASVFFEDGPSGPLFGRIFDLGEFAWLTGVQPPVALYYCTEIPGAENEWQGQNETGWCDPAYDRAAKTAATTLEREASLPHYYEAQKLFAENLPVIPLFAKVKVMATSPDVVNFRPNPTVNSETWNIETWGFKP